MEDYSILDIKSVFTSPYTLNFIEYVNCPRCETEIDVFNKVVDENSFVYCENCEHTILFKLVKI